MGLFRLSAAAAIFLTLAAPALAEAKQDKIRALLKLTNANATATKTSDALADQMLASLQNNNPSVPPTAWLVMQQELDEAFNASVPQLVEAMVPLYDRHFTESELDDLMAFYSTPTGRKTLVAVPALMQESMAVGQKMAPQITEKAVQKAMIRIREMGYTR